MPNIQLADTVRALAAISATVLSLTAVAHTVEDTRVPARGDAYWLDNERILFVGLRFSSSEHESGKRKAQTVIYIWSERQRKASVYAQIPDGDYVCYSDGYISYATRKNGVRYIKEGNLGSEIERMWDPSKARQGIDRNKVTCRDFDFRSAGAVFPGYLLVPLREGDGYYGWKKSEGGANDKNGALYYFRPGPDQQPARLPIEKSDFTGVHYSQFLDAYVFEAVPPRRDDATVATVVAVSRNGAQTAYKVPGGPWLGGSVWFEPASPGLVMASRAIGFKSRKDPGNAGVYLVREARVDRLLSGFPHRPSVSPDGCKVGVVVNMLGVSEQQSTLQIVTLCEGGDRK